jgi:protein AbiQ
VKQKNIYKLHYLSAEFYKKYDTVTYPEIERKTTRPYIVVLVKIDNNTFALPLRTNIKHSNCYRFKNSSRPTSSTTGIDFSKAVILNCSEYIGDRADIDKKEYIELNDKSVFIVKKFKTYLKGYYKYVSGDISKFKADNYKYTTLRYFHKELGLEV